jgi:hypothetical protein
MAEQVEFPKVFAKLKSTVDFGGIVIISDIHGETNGLIAADFLVNEINGKSSKVLLIETPDGNKSYNKNNTTFLDGYDNYTKNSVSFDKKHMRRLINSAVSKSWQVRSSDSAKYINGGFGLNAIPRQDYIARNIKDCFDNSTGCIAVNGSLHVKGNAKSRMYAFKSLTYILTGGKSFKKEPLLKAYDVKMPKDLSSTEKPIRVHVIPKHLVANKLTYAGGKDGL